MKLRSPARLPLCRPVPNRPRTSTFKGPHSDSPPAIAHEAKGTCSPRTPRPALDYALGARDPQILCGLALEPAWASSQVCFPENGVDVHAPRPTGGPGGAICEGEVNGAWRCGQSIHACV